MARRALVGLLLRRELGLPAMVVFSAAIVMGVVAADAAIAMLDRPTAGVLESAISRFHMTMLRTAGLLIVLRVAVRGQEDHASEWLIPYMAAGGSRWFHGLAVALVVATSMTLLFIAGAASFAISLFVMNGTADVLRLMPMLVLGGGLGLFAFAMLTMAISLVARDALGTIVATFVVVALPNVLFLLALRGGPRDVSPWLEWLLRLSPSLFIPGSTLAWVIRIGFVAVSLLLVTVIGHRRTARYA